MAENKNPFEDNVQKEHDSMKGFPGAESIPAEDIKPMDTTNQTINNILENEETIIPNAQPTQDLQQTPEDKVAQQVLADLYKEYGLNFSNLQKGETNVRKLVKEVEHVGLRFLNIADVKNMSEEQRAQYETKMARKVKTYDLLKRIGINGYNFEGKMALSKAKKIRDTLQSNLKSFEKELNGEYVSEKSELSQKILDALPTYVRSDSKFSSAIKDLEQKAGNSNTPSGLRSLKRELGKQGRFYTGIHDLLQNTIIEYENKMNSTKGDIDKTQEKLSNEPRSEVLIQERLKLDALYGTYEDERDQAKQAEERTLDQLLQIKAKYELTDQQIKLRETTAENTKAVLNNLTAGIEYMKNYIQSKRDVVVIGNHIMTLTYARDIADKINVQGIAAGMASVMLLKTLTEQQKESLQGPISDTSRRELKTVRDQAQDYKRSQVESFKKQINNGTFYST